MYVTAAIISALLLLRPTLQQSVSIVPLYLDNPALDLNAARRAKNVAYYGVYELGTPARQFKTCFDTGSADLWVPSTSCSDSTCLTKDRFASNTSSSFKLASYKFEVNYATGSVVGQVGHDTVSVGTPAVTVSSQGIGLATDSTSDFLSTSCDGLWGLGFVSLSQMRQRPPFFTMLAENKLQQSLFSIWLSPDPDVLEAGELVLGGTNPNRYSGSITYLDVSSATYWAVGLTGISVGSTQVAISATQAIVDSGSTAILLSSSDAFAIHQVIGNLTYDSSLGVYTLDCGCTCVASLPWVTFVLQGQTFSLPASAYMMQNSDGVCLSSIIPGGQAGSVVLGSNFMRQWYSVFTWDNSTETGQIGLAKAAASPGTSAVPSVSDDIDVALAKKSKSQGRRLAATQASSSVPEAAAGPDQASASEHPPHARAAAEPLLVQDGTPLLRVQNEPLDLPAGTTQIEVQTEPFDMPAGSAAVGAALRGAASEAGQQGVRTPGQGGSGVIRHSGSYRAQQSGPRSEGFVTLRSKHPSLHRHRHNL